MLLERPGWCGPYDTLSTLWGELSEHWPFLCVVTAWATVSISAEPGRALARSAVSRRFATNIVAHLFVLFVTVCPDLVVRLDERSQFAYLDPIVPGEYGQREYGNYRNIAT